MGNSGKWGGCGINRGIGAVQISTVGGKEMEKRCIQIGLLDTKGYESDQRVYSRGSVATH